MAEPLERPLSKSLQRGEDPHFDQILCAFGSVAEHCLPSLLKTLIAWYDKQGVEWSISEYKPGKSDSKGKSELSHVTEMEFVSERRDLAVEFIFCLVLIEVIKQLPVSKFLFVIIIYIYNNCTAIKSSQSCKRNFWSFSYCFLIICVRAIIPKEIKYSQVS